ncbi:MAG: hypothetical protein QXH30_02795 [Candidatus Bilamarchaeaceae archaeon]
MIQIVSPRSVGRGQWLKGFVEVKKEDLEGARAVEAIFYNSITYGRDKKNYSSWKYSKKVSAREAMERGEIPFEFEVKEFAPITYSGKAVISKWKLKVKVDIEGALDKEIEEEVAVFR